MAKFLSPVVNVQQEKFSATRLRNFKGILNKYGGAKQVADSQDYIIGDLDQGKKCGFNAGISEAKSMS